MSRAMSTQEKINALEKVKACIKSNKFGIDWWGICHICWSKELTIRQSKYIQSILPTERTKGNFQNYVWEPAKRRPRLNWINKQIKQLEKV